jgi:cytochrome c oxidase assembly protein subunit 15
MPDVKFPALRPMALASLIANIALVVTGAAVRLTDSGLGCPTWPKCTDQSYTTTAAMGVHGVIEFGNRLLGWVLAAIVVVCFVAAWRERPRRRSTTRLAVANALGVPAQGVMGGITVLTKLNPWVVGAHFLLSMALIAISYALWRRTAEGDGAPVSLVPGPLRALARLLALAGVAVLVAGVVVTGSGPHSGDHGAKRNGLDPAAVSQAHADLVFLLVGLTVALWFALRAVGAPRPAVRAAAALLGIELGQGLIGFVQYFTSLPVALVAAHMLGASLVWTGTLAVLWSLRTRPAALPPTEPRLRPTAAEHPVPAA